MAKIESIFNLFFDLFAKTSEEKNACYEIQRISSIKKPNKKQLRKLGNARRVKNQYVVRVIFASSLLAIPLTSLIVVLLYTLNLQ